jgi:hypothetical protein
MKKFHIIIIMKKLSAFCTLFLLLGFSSISWAQDPNVPFVWIGDTPIYGSADTIVGPGIQGQVSYDALTNTLYMDNASIPNLLATDLTGVQPCFKIRLSGDNHISSMMYSTDSCAFFGPGTVTIGGPSVSQGIMCANTDYLILTQGATVDITASYAGIDAMSADPTGHIPALVVNNSSLIITAPECFFSMWALWLSGCHVVEPEDFDYQLDTWLDVLSVHFQNYLEIRAGTVGVPARETAVWQAWGVEGGIRMEGLPHGQTVEVMSLLGQTLHQFKSSATNDFVPLKAGVYLVRVNNQTIKTIVN